MTDLYVKSLEYPDELIDGQVFNAGYENHSISELAAMARDVVGEDVEIATSPTDDLRSYHVSSEKIRRVLGFTPRRSIRDAIESLYDAFRRSGAGSYEPRCLLQHQDNAGREPRLGRYWVARGLGRKPHDADENWGRFRQYDCGLRPPFRDPCGRAWHQIERLSGKREIRDTLRKRDGGELVWRKLQTLAYGQRMSEAEMIPGVERFMALCRERGVALSIVSHKTRYANFGSSRVDLRRAALTWMTEHGLFDDEHGLTPEDVHFGDTRSAKISRIAALDCAIFVDDLIEVFSETAFPDAVRPILFDPTADAGPATARTAHGRPIDSYPSWDLITEHVFDLN